MRPTGGECESEERKQTGRLVRLSVEVYAVGMIFRLQCEVFVTGGSSEHQGDGDVMIVGDGHV